jgi:hypothetical protein
MNLNLLQQTIQLAQSVEDRVAQSSFWAVSIPQVNTSPNELLPGAPSLGQNYRNLVG